MPRVKADHWEHTGSVRGHEGAVLPHLELAHVVDARQGNGPHVHSLVVARKFAPGKRVLRSSVPEVGDRHVVHDDVLLESEPQAHRALVDMAHRVAIADKLVHPLGVVRKQILDPVGGLLAGPLPRGPGRDVGGCVRAAKVELHHIFRNWRVRYAHSSAQDSEGNLCIRQGVAHVFEAVARIPGLGHADDVARWAFNNLAVHREGRDLVHVHKQVVDQNVLQHDILDPVCRGALVRAEAKVLDRWPCPVQHDAVDGRAVRERRALAEDALEGPRAVLDEELQVLQQDAQHGGHRRADVPELDGRGLGVALQQRVLHHERVDEVIQDHGVRQLRAEGRRERGADVQPLHPHFGCAIQCDPRDFKIEHPEVLQGDSHVLVPVDGVVRGEPEDAVPDRHVVRGDQHTRRGVQRVRELRRPHARDEGHGAQLYVGEEALALVERRGHLKRVAVAVDLDIVRLYCHGREEAQEVAGPLRVLHRVLRKATPAQVASVGIECDVLLQHVPAGGSRAVCAACKVCVSKKCGAAAGK
mmetsp:Transcript_49224/g.140880  ORF Transcript_49224/g.140880 Transcript_49224/m.140880 type:complete len:528 (-) Transcript_49224:118-1701(-)|eukprot:CAMPEP_0168397596 /NCGR_PEP_ID=MMETSP0228-20121227/21148_1 /TAXON_ID=133427 /ORGANISM="Protoceratium reticulatum, Strain CCCM 535 (=CCMP 1889)" /LENGTH=527 /DNA_ID=CAMNT_0008411079 /DNA_START=121 /DNA_END=1704 /DNA_ORIENTATION=+